MADERRLYVGQNEASKMETELNNTMINFLFHEDSLSTESSNFFSKLITSDRLENVIEKSKEAIEENVIDFLRRRNKFFKNLGSFLKFFDKFDKN